MNVRPPCRAKRRIGRWGQNTKGKRGRCPVGRALKGGHQPEGRRLIGAEVSVDPNQSKTIAKKPQEKS